MHPAIAWWPSHSLCFVQRFNIAIGHYIYDQLMLFHFLFWISEHWNWPHKARASSAVARWAMRWILPTVFCCCLSTANQRIVMEQSMPHNKPKWAITIGWSLTKIQKVWLSIVTRQIDCLEHKFSSPFYTWRMAMLVLSFTSKIRMIVSVWGRIKWDYPQSLLTFMTYHRVKWYPDDTLMIWDMFCRYDELLQLDGTYKIT